MIKQLLTLGLVTAGVTWLAKSRNMIGGEAGESMDTRKRMGSDSTNRNMRSGSMKSDTVGTRDTTYSPSHAAPRSDSSGVYHNPTATGTRTSTSSASPGTYGPGSTSTKQ
ncbi:MAG: hypothetical protein ACXW30_02805 [Micavibrio sp.]